MTFYAQAASNHDKTAFYVAVGYLISCWYEDYGILEIPAAISIAR